jgi:hypothetical protein
MSDTIVQTIRYTLGLFIPLASVAYVLERDESGYVFVAGALLSLTVAGVLFATWWAVLFMPPVIVVGFIVITFSSGGRGLGAEYHGPISEVVLFLLVIFSLFVPAWAISTGLGVGMVKAIQRMMRRRLSTAGL